MSKNKNDKTTNKLADFMQGREQTTYRNSQLELLGLIELNTEETFAVTQKGFNSFESKLSQMIQPKSEEDLLRTDDNLILLETKKTNEILTDVFELQKKDDDSEGGSSGLLGIFSLFFSSMIAHFAKKIGAVFKVIPKMFSNVFSKMFGGLKNSKFFKGISNIFGGVKSRLLKIFKPILSIFSKGKGVFSILGKALRPIKGIFKVFGKIAPLLKFAKAIPFVGVAITAIFALIDGIKGFFKAGEFFNLDEKDLNIGHKISSVVGSIISGLTFGLLDPANISKALYSFYEPVVKSVMEIFNPKSDTSLPVRILEAIMWFVTLTPRMVWKAISSLFDIGNDETSMFGKVLTGLKSFVAGIPKAITDIASFLFNPENGMFSGFIDGLKTIFTILPKMITDVASFLFNPENGMFSGFIETVGTAIGKVFSFISEMLLSSISKVKGSISSFFFGEDDVDSATTKREAKNDKPIEVIAKRPEELDVLSITESNDPNVRQRSMMNFLLNEFSDAMANKIAMANKGKDVSQVRTPVIQPFR